MGNLDPRVVEAYENEWTSYGHDALPQGELRELFEEQFELFPWDSLPRDAVGFDIGCGGGEMAQFVAPRVGKLVCIDPSNAAVENAKRLLDGVGNCEFHVAAIDAMPIPDATMDFGYCMGVLPYLPDPLTALKSCVEKLKPNAPFLLTAAYTLENRPLWFRALGGAADLIRRIVSRQPRPVREAAVSAIAFGVYLPLARFALLLETLGLDVDGFPLSSYRRGSFRRLRDGAYRFAMPLEKRCSVDQLKQMMSEAGLQRIVFSQTVYSRALGYTNTQS